MKKIKTSVNDGNQVTFETFKKIVSDNFPKHWESLLATNGVLKYAIIQIAKKASKTIEISKVKDWLSKVKLIDAANWKENELEFWKKMSKSAERIKNER